MRPAYRHKQLTDILIGFAFNTAQYRRNCRRSFANIGYHTAAQSAARDISSAKHLQCIGTFIMSRSHCCYFAAAHI